MDVTLEEGPDIGSSLGDYTATENEEINGTDGNRRQDKKREKEVDGQMEENWK